jgi:hypothetical protein
MKIQYIIDKQYDKQDTLKVAGILLKIMLNTLLTLKNRVNHLESTDLLFYPLNTQEIEKKKKLLLISSDKAKGILEYIDKKFMSELAKEELNVLRREQV